MNVHDIFLRRVMNHYSTVDMYGSGFASFSVEEIGGVRHLVAQNLLTGDVMQESLDDPQAVYTMFDRLATDRLSSGFKDGIVYGGGTHGARRGMPGVLNMSYGIANFRRKGIYRNQQLFDLSQESDISKVTVKYFDKQADKALETVARLISDNPNDAMSLDMMADNIKGLVVPTKSGLQLIQIHNQEGNILSFRESVERLGLDPFSVSVNGEMQNIGDIFGKKGKRYRGHFQNKGISLNLDSRMKAAVFDPQSLFNAGINDIGSYKEFLDQTINSNFSEFKNGREMAEKALKQMFDGQIIAVRPEVLIKESERGGGRFIDRLDMDRFSVYQAKQTLDNYIRLMRRGNTFNVRLTNPEFVGSDKVSGVLDVGEISGRHLKGNMSIADGLSSLTDKELNDLFRDTDIDPMTRALAKVFLDARREGIDFLAPSDSVTAELGGLNTGGKFQMGIAVQNESHVARTNVTTLVGQPSFYDVHELEEYARNNVDMELKNLKRGQISEGFLENLRRQAGMVLEDFYDYHDLTVDQMSSRRMVLEEARAIVNFLDTGGRSLILNDPAMTNRIRKAIKHTYYGADLDNPSFIIPNAKAGHIAPDKMVTVQSRRYGNQRFGQLREDFIAYDKTTNQFVLPTVNAGLHQEYLEILGGADYDDTINTALFYDQNADEGHRIAAAIYRNPTGYGEGLVLKMHANDDMVIDVLLKMNETADYSGFDDGLSLRESDRAFIQRVRENKQELNRVDRKILRHRRKLMDPRLEANKKQEIQTLIDALEEQKAVLQSQSIIIDDDINVINNLEEIAGRVLRPADQALRVATRVSRGGGGTYRYFGRSNPEPVFNYGIDGDLEPERGLTGNQTINQFLGRFGFERGRGEGRYFLGEVLNFRTFMESLLYEGDLDGMGTDVLGPLLDAGFDPRNIRMSTRESIIDYFIQLGGTGERASTQVDRALDAVAQALVDSYQSADGLEGAAKLPFSTASLSGKGAGLLSQSIHDRLTELIQERLPGVTVTSETGDQRLLTITDFIMDKEAENTPVAVARRLAAEGSEAADALIRNFDTHVSGLKLNAYASSRYTEDYQRAAMSIVDQFNEDALGDIEGLNYAVKKQMLNDEMAGKIFGEATAIADAKNIDSVEALKEILLNIRSEAADKGILGQMLEVLDSEYDPKMSVKGMLRRALTERALELHDQNIITDIEVEGISDDTLSKLDPDDLKQIKQELEEYGLSDEEIRKGVPGQNKNALRAMGDAIAARIPQTKNLIEGMQALWHVDVFRKGFYGVAAVAAASAIYQNSKDVSPEEMQGPEFLPGGSAYEDFMQPGVDYSSFNGFRSQSGTTYSIQTNGQYDPAMVTAAAEQITGATAQGMISYRQPVFADTNRAISNGF